MFVEVLKSKIGGSHRPVNCHPTIAGEELARVCTLQCFRNRQGIGHANARSAILGTWSGPKANALVERIIAESGASDL